MKKEKQSYNIWTIGCQMNEADSRHLASRLEKLGYQPGERAEDADMVVLNTCVVRASAENKVRGKLKYLEGLKKRRPEMKIALMGCFVGRGVKQAKLQKEFPFVDILMPPSDISPLEEHLAKFKVQDTPPTPGRSETCCGTFELPHDQSNAVSANVPAVLGCSHACTYCVIPYRRGREHSRPESEILSEVETLADQGVKEVVLLGQIIDRYGIDLSADVDLSDLLRDAARIDGVERIRFLTSHPSHMTERIIAAVADVPKICPHFELPCQAGNDEVLQRMRRGYTREQFIDLVELIRSHIPTAAINTDIIVGFPGETEDEFLDTSDLLQRVGFDTVHIAKYSPRPQTYAARRMRDDVPPDEKERRRLHLDNLQKKILTRKNAAFMDRTVDVLVEDRDQKHGRWRGRTPENKLVFIEDERNLLGRIVNVKINWAGPYSMLALHKNGVSEGT